MSVTVPNTITNAAGTGASRQVYQFTAATGGTGRGFFLDTTEMASTNSRDQLLGDIDGDIDLLTSIGLFGMNSYLNNRASAPNFAFLSPVLVNTYEALETLKICWCQSPSRC